jgi:hypothetical protein
VEHAHSKPIGCKWVYKTKTNPDDTLRYKARLVIKGYEQVQGVDFEETYAPVSKMPTLRYLMACAAQGGWEIDQLDVVTAFLNPVFDIDQTGLQTCSGRSAKTPTRPCISRSG